MTFRCSNCAINYPYHIQFQTCHVCETTCSPFADDGPDEDWDQKVARARMVEEIFEDKTMKYRLEMMLRWGYPREDALVLAERRDVDLHRAEDLAQKAGVPLALEILL